jgi:AbrB family looped-hinge helix DNA binding protein
MVEISITSMSSKGQIVIPRNMRENIKKGERIVIIKSDNKLILKNMKDFNKNIEEDLEFARRTEEAYQRYERGEFKEMDFDEFIKEMKKW